MKLGSLKSKLSRDGELVVVSRDNQKAVKVPQIASFLQQVLDRWDELSPQLEKVYAQLNEGKHNEAFAVSEDDFHSPLPRAYQWLDGSAYIQHIKLVRKARGAELPETLETVPLMYQGGSDSFLAPRENIPLVSEAHGMDFEAEIVVYTGDVPLGTKEAEAEKYIRLVGICNDVSLRGLIPEELSRGFGFLQSKPASAFAPFVVTPDELGEEWKNGKLHLPLYSELNGEKFGDPEAGEMFFSFPKLIEHAARTRELAAGTILGSGTVANEDSSRGSSCLAEKRMLEKINEGEIKTPFMKVGDRIRIWMNAASGENLFGEIDQKIIEARVKE